MTSHRRVCPTEAIHEESYTNLKQHTTSRNKLHVREASIDKRNELYEPYFVIQL